MKSEGSSETSGSMVGEDIELGEVSGFIAQVGGWNIITIDKEWSVRSSRCQ